MSRFEIVVVLVIAFAFVGFCVFAVWAVSTRSDFEDRCIAASGVPVKSHLGPLLCFDRDALLFENEPMFGGEAGE